jgi:hypothetical protein
MNQHAIALIANELTSRGIKPEVAAGAIAGLMGESGGDLDPTAFNAKDPGGGSGGIGQWNRERLIGPTGMLAFAREHGIDVNVNVPTDSKKVPLAVQVLYLGHELDTRYKYVTTGLRSLTTGEQGLTTWVNNYEAPLEKGKAIAQRRQYIAPVAGLLGAGGASANAADEAKGAVAAPSTETAGTPEARPEARPEASPLAGMGMSLGQALAGISGGEASTGSVQDPPDQPAIRSPALGEDFTPPASNPVPANLAVGAGGGSPMAQQLGALAATPIDPALANPAIAPSITAGAPGMTTMLGDVGTTGGIAGLLGGKVNLMNPYQRPTRLG